MFRFEGLEIWKRSAVLTVELMGLSDELESEHKYKIADQLRRAVLSITNNIAEGSGSSSRKDFRLFLNYSHRSVFECANIVMICEQSGWVERSESAYYINELEVIAKMIISFSCCPCKDACNAGKLGS